MSSPYCLFRPLAFPSLPSSWFISPCSSSSLFLSTWCFLSFSCFFFCVRFLVHLFFGWGSSPRVFAFLLCCHCVSLDSNPSLLSFLPWLAVIFRTCLFCAYSCASGFLIASFSYFFLLSFSLCASSFSCPLSFSGLFPFLPLLFIQFPYPGFPFGSCCGFAFLYSRC